MSRKARSQQGSMLLIILISLMNTFIAECLGQTDKNETKNESINNCIPVKLSFDNISIMEVSDEKEALKLFDEQEIAGDPSKKIEGNTETIWNPVFKNQNSTSQLVINLKDKVFIHVIYLRDENNKGRFTMEAGTPGNWVNIVDDSLKNYKTWNKHNTNITTQFLRITKYTGGSNVSELVFYGCLLPDGGPPSAIQNLNTTTITDNSVKLIWKSTGDDGDFGISEKLEIRKSLRPIQSEYDFQNADKVENSLTPLYSGQVQSFLVRGLAPETVYYFSIRAVDNKGNQSPISKHTKARTNQKIAPRIITMDKSIGINAFVDDPIDKLKAVGFIREYHNWRWDEGGPNEYQGYPNNKIKWAPSAAGNFWNFDSYYSEIIKQGLEISPVIQGTVPWLNKTKQSVSETKPVDELTSNSKLPESYRAKSHHMFQFAARYGSSIVNDKLLTLDQDQQRVSGLGYINYLEDWNEPNKHWLGPEAEFTPEEYAAMSSANFDGHCKEINYENGTFGIRNADPKMKFVMAGSVSINLKWIDNLKIWFENNRPDHRFIFDVINVHHYSWLNGKNWQGGGPAKSPEEDHFKERLSELITYRDSNFPNTEVWISEFGWDTNPGSPLCVPLIAPHDREEIQGQWIVRAYLAFAAAGIDRAQVYMLRDVNSNSGGWFATCGLTKQKGDWTPKKSWYYVYTLKNTLTNMVFIGEQNSDAPNVLIYKFKDIYNESGAYVIWSKTKYNNEVKGFKLMLDGHPTKAEQIEMVAGKTEGEKTKLTIDSSKVTINISERPIFVVVDKIN